MAVASRLIVERFDVVRNVCDGNFPVLVDSLFDALFLQTAEERFGERIVRQSRRSKPAQASALAHPSVDHRAKPARTGVWSVLLTIRSPALAATACRLNDSTSGRARTQDASVSNNFTFASAFTRRAWMIV